MKKTIRCLLIFSLFILPFQPVQSDLTTDTWANWHRYLDQAYKNVHVSKIPGHTMGIIVPHDPRRDIYQMSGFGYELLSKEKVDTIIIMMPPPYGTPADGILMPGFEVIDTAFGTFQIDTLLANEFVDTDLNIQIDVTTANFPITDVLLTQLAHIKYVYKNKTSRLKILPMFVELNNLNSQVKDMGPRLAETIKMAIRKKGIFFVAVADLSLTISEPALIKNDAAYLNAIRNLDIESLIQIKGQAAQADSLIRSPHVDPIALAALTLRWLGADHSEILAYAHSGQLILTKDKSTPISYVVAGVASGPVIPPRLKHIKIKHMEKIFDEVFRNDILAMTRQTCASILDPTAAEPPGLINKWAGKSFPVFVSLYAPDGSLASQAGSHKSIGPLEESIRQFAFKAVQQAQPALTKENFSTYVVDISIPYGFRRVSSPSEIIPFLNGLVVDYHLKEFAFHPEAWRRFPDPHQLLGQICTNIGLLPWDYATRQAHLKSFRVLSFNEKDPYQELESPKKKKRNRGQQDDVLDDEIFDGGFTF